MNYLYLVRFQGKCQFVVVAPDSETAKWYYRNFAQSWEQGQPLVPHFHPMEVAEIAANPQRFKVRRLGTAERDTPVGVVTSETHLEGV